MSRRRAVLVCPGRGTYNKTELGYIRRHHGHEQPFLKAVDERRLAQGKQSLAELDGARQFSLSTYSRGDVASPLICACTVLDAQAIADDFEIVAVTGNSMGWYTALGLGGSVTPFDAFGIVEGMGELMQRHLIGGQLVYPHMDETWHPDPGKRRQLIHMVDEINTRNGNELHLSIDLGGMLVLAGNSTGLKAFADAVPVIQERYPMHLANHAAFHSPLQRPNVGEAQRAFSPDMFAAPSVPMIDGRGVIWWPHSSDPVAIHTYTFGAQITDTYDFTAAIRTAAREFAPDVFIVTGPGASLGSAVIQSLILCGWKGLGGKQSFLQRQSESPIVLSMGREDQRDSVTKGSPA